MELIMFTVGNLFGIGGKYAMLFCVFSFAYATVICWYYYGLESWSALFGKKKRALFLPLFLIFVFLGCFSDSYTLVLATDLLMAIATILTLSALIKNSDRIKHLSESGGVIDSDMGRIRPFRIKGNVFSKGERHR
jgi:Na+/alanine symporter